MAQNTLIADGTYRIYKQNDNYYYIDTGSSSSSQDEPIQILFPLTVSVSTQSLTINIDTGTVFSGINPVGPYIVCNSDGLTINGTNIYVIQLQWIPLMRQRYPY